MSFISAKIDRLYPANAAQIGSCVATCTVTVRGIVTLRCQLVRHQDGLHLHLTGAESPIDSVLADEMEARARAAYLEALGAKGGKEATR